MPEAFTGELSRPPACHRFWMLAGNPALFVDRLVREHGDFIHYRGPFNFYLINHPALVKQVLKETNRSFDKNSIIYNRFRNAFGDGLVVSEGEKWRRQRKMMQPVFNPVAVRQFFEMMVGATNEMCDRWQEIADEDRAFNVADEMHRLTLSIAGRALFSSSFEGMDEKIEAWTQTINSYSSKPPIPIVTDLWFPSPTNRRLKTTLREFHQFLHGLISERPREKPGDDLLGIFLQARDEDTGKSMSEPELIDEVLGMIIAGHETSSGALSWIWYELNRNPEIDQRLHDELVAVLGDGPITIEALSKLSYTRMVIEETLRLHPPFWFENRNAMADFELGGITLPKGSMIAFSRYSLHRHAAFWHEPDQFKPERFDKKKLENERSSYAYLPFGGGPRICIGINFAMQELLTVIASVCRRYRVVVDADDRHQMAAQVTLFPKHGVRVRLKKR